MSALAPEVNSGTGNVRPELSFDAHVLSEWMSAHVRGFEGPLRVEQFNGGQSNPTYKLTTPTVCYVLRRKPPGPLVQGAHDVIREARVLAALHETGFPVAAVYAVCPEEDVIGTPFFVMQMVEGRIFWNTTFPEVTRDRRPDYFAAMNATIARLHTLDYGSIGLTDFGRPGNYFARQISRWTRQYLDDPQAGRDPNMDMLIDWLPANIPNLELASVTHGDFRCDNLIFHPTEPRIIAVLDWELSTIGHPLADFAYHAMMYRMPPDIVAGLAGADLTALNIPSEEDYVADYCRRTNRQSIPFYDFYVAFNFFRLAAIFHGIKGRVLRGTAASKQASQRAESFPRLAQLARQSMEACR